MSLIQVELIIALHIDTRIIYEKFIPNFRVFFLLHGID